MTAKQLFDLADRLVQPAASEQVEYMLQLHFCLGVRTRIDSRDRARRVQHERRSEDRDPGKPGLPPHPFPPHAGGIVKVWILPDDPTVRPDSPAESIAS